MGIFDALIKEQSKYIGGVYPFSSKASNGIGWHHSYRAVKRVTFCTKTWQIIEMASDEMKGKVVRNERGEIVRLNYVTPRN